jgi:hypothetical protein
MQASPKHVRAPHAHTIDYSTRIVRRSRSWENGRASVLSMAELTRKPRRVVEGVAGTPAGAAPSVVHGLRRA